MLLPPNFPQVVQDLCSTPQYLPVTCGLPKILNPLGGDYMKQSSAMDDFVQRVQRMYVWDTQMGVTFINLVNTETKQIKKVNFPKEYT